MGLERHLLPDFVCVGLEVKDKEHLLDVLCHMLIRHPALAQCPHATPEQVKAAILEREELHSTALGKGFAFPHARMSECIGVALGFATLKTPVDFGALDGIPVDVVALAVVPNEHATVALKLLANFARVMQNSELAQTIRRFTDANALCAFLHKIALSSDGPVLARDIMRAPLANIFPETPISHVVRVMLRHNLDAISVISHDGLLLGQITCDDIFKLGIPDFFTHLKTVSFLPNYDPFDKYFKEEGSLCAGDVMTQDYCALPEDATLLEVIFALAVKRHYRVYVVHEGKRVGIIDRALVLDRVINI